ncbi:type II toxin-antitoxin system RelE/ParE family toxin [Caulobacter sp.]|uniref:type II toxin-antitoxin system RelE/ParE family toxin n=1 Tax=Caulobacter sp. TaxID=78 RepID=UPI001B071584|nr:type II toxin-antitoxin system RelE/ParE family toxin [Caulobacter sp.]MBO9544639.1 type II toxin-antitoxin system RelE/ParE family toxin [Caulobacter sp.]
MKTWLSSIAMSDLRSIVTGVAKDRLILARRVTLEFHAACLALGETPEAYAKLQHLLDGEVRRHPMGRFSIYYCLRETDVIVIRMLESAQHVAGRSTPNAP